jgi:PAS domain S-box-containing protein
MPVTLFEALPLGLFQAAADGTLSRVNTALHTLLQTPPPHEIGQQPINLFTDIIAFDAEADRLRAALEQGHDLASWELRVRRSDGMLLWVAASIAIHPAPEQGAPPIISGSLENITVRKLHEEIAIDLETKYRSIFDNAQEGIFQITPGE